MILKENGIEGVSTVETELNKTAAKTQAWQCAYFNEIVHE